MLKTLGGGPGHVHPVRRGPVNTRRAEAGIEGPAAASASRVVPVRTLRMPWDLVHEEAEHMEHSVSDRLVDRIEALPRLPDGRDPHGDLRHPPGGCVGNRAALAASPSCPAISGSALSGWSTRSRPSFDTCPSAA
ncbi:MAG: iron dependent repressor, metal binding and dimerization domain protein [Isosphaeraceae bacterium]